MLQVIMIARLHAMYQGSRTMLIFLVIIFLGVNVACGVITAIGLKHTAAGMFYLLTAEHSSLDNARGAHTLWHAYLRF
jgi:predicted RND superfamily exporter protein